MKTIALAVAIALASAMPIAHAQWTVIDPTNLIQNTLTAMRTLDQINKGNVGELQQAPLHAAVPVDADFGEPT